MAGRWYYDLMGEVFGPVTWQQILESVSAGLLSDSDRVRPEAANTWQTIASVGSIASVGRDAATPSTDSPEQLQVVDSLDDILMEDASMVAASVPSTAKMQSPHKPAPFRPAPFRPDPVQPIQAQPIQVQPQYFVEMFGTVMGPMEFAVLAAMITDHQVAATDQARSADSDIWRPVNQFPELQATLAAVPQMPVEPAPQPAPKLRPAAAAQPALEKQQLPQSLPVAEPKPSDGADFTLSPTATLSEAEALAKAEKRRRMEERGNRPAARRRRKKSNAETPQYDPIMQEIYEEVFKDRDQQDSGASGQARPAAAVGSIPAESSPAAATAPSTAVPASAAALTSSMPANAAVNLPSGHVAPAALPPAFSMPTAKPTLSGPRLSSGKSSSSFQLPDPKILGIGAGGTAIVGLIAALAMGWISLPGIGPGGATTDRAKAAIIACNMEIQALGQGPIRQVDWIEFTGTIQGRVAPLLSGSDAITDEQVTKAAKLLMDVAKCNPLKEAAKIKETAAQLGTIVNQM